MKIAAKKRLFWNLKESAELDLSHKGTLDMYVQQVLMHGTTKDVHKLIAVVPIEQFCESYNRIKRFLPALIAQFWDHWFENNHSITKTNT